MRCVGDDPSDAFCSESYADLPTVLARPEDVYSVLAEQDEIPSHYFCHAYECSDEPVIVVGCRYNQYGRAQAPTDDSGLVR